MQATVFCILCTRSMHFCISKLILARYRIASTCLFSDNVAEIVRIVKNFPTHEIYLILILRDLAKRGSVR